MPAGLFSSRFIRGRRALLAATLGLAGSIAGAQGAYPNKPVTFIVGWPPGGSTDYVARVIAPELGKQLGTSVVVDNVPGAGSVLGFQKASNAQPDGYTVYLGGTELIVPPMVNPKVQYDWKSKLTPVGQFAFVWFVLAAPVNAPYNNLREFIDHAKKNPGKVTYASAGVASTQHMLGELIRERAVAPIVHIPYRGGPQFTQDLLAGNIDTAWLTVAGMLAQVPGGRLKAIAVSSDKRVAQLPDVPALGETRELSGVSMGAWMGLFVPNGTPPAVLQRLSTALEATMKSPAVVQPLEKAGAIIKHTDGPTFARFIDGEVGNYKRIVDFAKMKVTE